MTNGTIEMDVCTVCGQPYREGHIDCTCPSNHAERCERPTYDQLKAQHDAQPATLAALATGAALIRRVLADGTNEIREYHVPQLEDFADELEASLSLAGLPRCSVVLMDENWIDEPTMECITHGGKSTCRWLLRRCELLSKPANQQRVSTTTCSQHLTERVRYLESARNVGMRRRMTS
jgi:hypothetical protein